jgi:hypothetical protein
VEIKITIRGTTPLLMHNVRLANPIDPYAKALSEATSTFKKTKTEADFLQVARTEWFGGLYHDPEIGVYVPSSWLIGTFARGGVNYGKKGLAVKQSLLLQELAYPLVHDGPADLEQMWADPQYRDIRAAGIGKNKVMRTRPKFPRWALEVPALLEESTLDFGVFQAIAEKAGGLAGMGDYRPEKSGPFGRYEVLVSKS